MQRQEFQARIKAVDTALAGLRSAIEALAASSDLTLKQAKLVERYQDAYESAKSDIWPVSTDAMNLD